MEFQDTIDSGNRDFDKSLSSASISFLRESAKWSRFLAIVGFVLIGIFVIVGLLFSSFISNAYQGIPSFAISLIYIVAAGIWLPPCVFLLRFAKEINRGIDDSDQNSIDAGFSALKSHFKYIGIFTLVILGIYGLVFVGGILSALF
ncbi:MAG: hypothetical protein WED33_02960 [Bacteroidia bacterium]